MSLSQSLLRLAEAVADLRVPWRTKPRPNPNPRSTPRARELPPPPRVARRFPAPPQAWWMVAQAVPTQASRPPSNPQRRARAPSPLPGHVRPRRAGAAWESGERPTRAAPSATGTAWNTGARLAGAEPSLSGDGMVEMPAHPRAWTGRRRSGVGCFGGLGLPRGARVAHALDSCDHCPFVVLMLGRSPGSPVLRLVGAGGRLEP